MKCKNSSSSSEVAGGRNVIGTDHSVNMKRPRDGQHPKYLGSLHVSFYSFYGILRILFSGGLASFFNKFLP